MSQFARYLVPVLFLLMLAGPALAQTSTPTPAPTPNPFNTDPIFQALATQNANLGTANTDLSAPGGSPILPNADGHEVFGYVKYLVSASGAEELFGPFAPIFIHLGIFIAGSMALTVVYVVIYAAAYVIRFVVFLFKLILEIADTLADIIQAIAEAGKTAFAAAVSFLGL